MFGGNYFGQPYLGQSYQATGTPPPPNQVYGGGPLGGYNEFGYNEVRYATAVVPPAIGRTPASLTFNWTLP